MPPFPPASGAAAQPREVRQLAGKAQLFRK